MLRKSEAIRDHFEMIRATEFLGDGFIDIVTMIVRYKMIRNTKN